MVDLLIDNEVRKKRPSMEGAWNGPPQTVIVQYTYADTLRSLSSSTTRKVSMVGIWADHCPNLNTSSDR